MIKRGKGLSKSGRGGKRLFKPSFKPKVKPSLNTTAIDLPKTNSKPQISTKSKHLPTSNAKKGKFKIHTLFNSRNILTNEQNILF